MKIVLLTCVVSLSTQKATNNLIGVEIKKNHSAYFVCQNSLKNFSDYYLFFKQSVSSSKPILQQFSWSAQSRWTVISKNERDQLIEIQFENIQTDNRSLQTIPSIRIILSYDCKTKKLISSLEKGDAKTFIEALVNNWQFYPSNNDSIWHMQEQDSFGSYLATYYFNHANEIKKRKRVYLTPPSALSSTSVQSSQSIFYLPSKTIFFSKIETTENLNVSFKGGSFFSISKQFSLSLNPLKFNKKRQVNTKSLSMPNKNSIFIDNIYLPNWVRNKSYVSKDPFSDILNLAEILQSNPGLAIELLNFLQNNDVNPQIVSMATQSLWKASCQTCEQVLFKLMSEETPAEIREAVVLNMASHSNPTQSLQEKMLNLCDETLQDELSNTNLSPSCLSLGRWALQTKLNPQFHASLKKLILNSLQKSSDESQLFTALGTASMLKSDKIRSAIEFHLKNPNPAIRAEAFISLLSQSTNEFLPLYIKKAINDSDEYVRKSFFETLQKYSLSTEQLALTINLDQIWYNEKSSTVRIAIVNWLGKLIIKEQIKNKLREWASKESSSAVIYTFGKYLQATDI